MVALVKVGQGHPGSITPGWPWFNPFEVTDFSAFASGIILMVFISWGWDTGVAVNEETKDRSRTPGLAASWRAGRRPLSFQVIEEREVTAQWR